MTRSSQTEEPAKRLVLRPVGSFGLGIRQAVTDLHQESGVDVVMSWEDNTTVLRTAQRSSSTLGGL